MILSQVLDIAAGRSSPAKHEEFDLFKIDMVVLLFQDRQQFFQLILRFFHG